MTLEKDYFDPSNALGSDANWSALEDIMAAKMLRFYNNDVTSYPNLDGHTEFNSDTNTNLLLVERSRPIFTDMDICGADGKKRRTMQIELITRDATDA